MLGKNIETLNTTKWDMCKINKWTCFNVITGWMHNHVLFLSHIKREIYDYRWTIQPNDWLISTDTAFRQLNQHACPQAFMTKSQLFQTDESMNTKAPGNNHTRDNKVVRYTAKSPVTGNCVIMLVVPDVLKDCDALTFSGQHTQILQNTAIYPTTERHVPDDLGLQ